MPADMETPPWCSLRRVRAADWFATGRRAGFSVEGLNVAVH